MHKEPKALNDENSESRKADHIDLAFKSQIDAAHADSRFYYEPMLAGHPDPESDLGLTFLGKQLKYPLWVSSMTGGTEMARTINRNLARMCAEFGFGMGLGSCRALLDSDERMDDFDMRDIIGDQMPLYANLGIAQVEECLRLDGGTSMVRLVEKLRADGLIVHVNPLQEWMQPEGDAISRAPIATIEELLEKTDLKVIAKEVGQGFGPESVSQLLQLPLEAIELAAHGGTNFTKLELLRTTSDKGEIYAQMATVGHSAAEMIEFINGAVDDLHGTPACRQIIISGGLKGFLDGYYLMNRLTLPSIYGHASMFLKYAKDDYETLREFAQMQVDGLKLANACLRVR
jgi:isopentenyl-diphosphate delta-isomerase